MHFGLALGGGGLKGAAHLGVLKVLVDHGLPPDLVVGTSAGAIAAALYGSGLLPSELSSQWSFPVFFTSSTRKIGGLPLGMLDGRMVENMFKRLWGKKRFSDLKKPVAVVACDLYSGHTIIYSALPPVRPLPPDIAMGGDVPVWQAVRASISIPALFSPFPLGPHLLVDGGVTANVPADVARVLGATKVIAVELSTTVTPSSLHNAGEVLMRSLDIMSRRLTALTLTLSADFVLSPLKDVYPPPGFWEVGRLKELVQAGAEATVRALPEIRKILEL